MKKRFKSRKKNTLNYQKIIFIFLVTLTSIYLSYNVIYNFYLSKLTNQEIINHIIINSKNNKYNGTLIDKYLNPQTIISNQFNLKESETITVENQPTSEPLVYIYSTHETEGYQDNYLEVYNIKPTVKNMSYILSDYLSDLGITTIIEEESITSVLRKNNWSYKYSYEASRQIITDTIANTPTLKLIIDLHRDSSSLDKTLIEYNNKKYARILFVVGKEHQEYEKNNKLSNQLLSLLEQEVPGITRGISLKEGTGVNGIYNQDLNPNIVLIELGGQYNEIEELNNSLEILSKVILKYIEGETWKIPTKLGLHFVEFSLYYFYSF